VNSFSPYTIKNPPSLGPLSIVNTHFSLQNHVFNFLLPFPNVIRSLNCPWAQIVLRAILFPLYDLAFQELAFTPPPPHERADGHTPPVAREVALFLSATFFAPPSMTEGPLFRAGLAVNMAFQAFRASSPPPPQTPHPTPPIAFIFLSSLFFSTTPSFRVRA